MLDLLQKSIAQYVLYGEDTSDEFVIHRLKVESATIEHDSKYVWLVDRYTSLGIKKSVLLNDGNWQSPNILESISELKFLSAELAIKCLINNIDENLII